MFFGFPQTDSTEECVLILTAFNSVWQATKTVHQAAAKNDVIGDEGFSQLGDCICYFSLPFFFAQQRQARNAEIIFDDVFLAIGQVAKFKRHQNFVPQQCGSQAGAESQKEHAPAAITAERLQGGIVDNPHGNTQRSGKIETNPSLAQMFRVFCDSSPPHRRGETDGSSIKVPSAHSFLESCDQLLRFQPGTGSKFTLIARRPEQFYMCAADIDDEDFSLHERRPRRVREY